MVVKKKIQKNIKKSSIITGLLMSIIPIAVLAVALVAWPIAIAIVSYCIPLFFIRKITKSKKRKYVFWIIPYILIHPSITLEYISSKIPEMTPNSPADLGAYLSLYAILFGFVFFLLFIIYSSLIFFFYFHDKKNQ